MAGCDYTASTCAGDVTQASYAAFTANWVKHPGQTNTSTDDFFLWWSYSVLGGTTVPVFGSPDSAEILVDKIYNGMIDNMPTSQNGLVAYLGFVLSQTGCANDVTACDLYSQVYIPMEAYFAEGISYQTSLAEAVVEAKGVLAEVDPGAR